MTAPDLREIVGGDPQAECGGQVLIGPGAIACLVTLGDDSRLYATPLGDATFRRPTRCGDFFLAHPMR